MSKLALLIVFEYWISIFISQSDIKQVSTIHQYSLACDKDKQLFWLDLGPIELGCQQFKRDLSNFEPDCIFFWSKFNQVIDATNPPGNINFQFSDRSKPNIEFWRKNIGTFHQTVMVMMIIMWIMRVTVMVMIRETRERQTPSAAYDAVTRPMSPFLSFYFLISVSFRITKQTDTSVSLINDYKLPFFLFFL